MRFATGGIGLVCLLTALGLGYTISVETEGMMVDVASPLRITYIFLGILGLFGVLLIASGYKEAKQYTPQSAGNIRLLLVFIGLCVVYVAAMSLMGWYVVCTAVFLFFSMKVLAVRTITALSVGVACSLTVFTVFQLLLGVPLP